MENEPEFAQGFRGKSNPAFVPEKDLEVNVGIPFQNVTRRNPLAELHLHESADPPTYEQSSSSKRKAPAPPVVNESSDYADDFIDEEPAVDSNFSFGANKLTSL